MEAPRTYTLELGGKTLQVEFNSLAEQTNGSVFVQMGGTLVLVTAVMSGKEREGADFFPLTVDYEEKYYAAGKIGGSRFIKREGRPSDQAVLNARLIDRTIRPLFPAQLRKEIQVIATVLSWDGENDADILGIMGASLALATSDIPWNGPVGAVRLGFYPEENRWTFNPTYKEQEGSLGEIVFSGCEREKGGVVVNMIEAGFRGIAAEKVEEAAELAFASMKKIIDFQKEVIAKEGRGKLVLDVPPKDEELFSQVRSLAYKKLEAILFGSTAETSKEKMELADTLKEEVRDQVLSSSDDETKAKAAGGMFEELFEEIIHSYAIDKEKRVDGRKPDEIRPLTARTRILPRTHGSAIFIRGTTKALSIVTLGAPGDQQLVEGMEISGKKRFMHHYNFPPYCSGEVKPLRGPGRREIGHGILAERAIEPLLPPVEEFPYTIRVVTEILSSNGSTSMASVSAASLALVDAGVPMKDIASGISIGLMSGPDGSYKLLTDIQGPEDHHGDMDFKVAGTESGITAIQMDVKIEGLTFEMFQKSLEKAREARVKILEEMKKAIPEPKPTLSPYAPRIITFQINPEKIRDVIGPGGKMINAIIAETGAAIDIEDDGRIFITSPSQEALEITLEKIKALTHEVSVGEVYNGTVKRVMEFGAFVEVLPGQEGLVHISRLAPFRVEKTTDIVRIGDPVTVKVIEIDDQGRINLTLLDKTTGKFIEKELMPRPSRPLRARRRSF